MTHPSLAIPYIILTPGQGKSPPLFLVEIEKPFPDFETSVAGIGRAPGVKGSR